jgi:hypothetical protein
MNQKLKILFAAIFFAMVFTQDKICQHLGFGQAKHHKTSALKTQKVELNTDDKSYEDDYFINDTLYRWDEQSFDWVITIEDTDEFQMLLAKTEIPDNTPLEIDWKVLIDIQYRLRFFKKIEQEIYAPVFSNAVKKLEGREVIIEGFVFPFEEEGDLLSLSQNPYASCFFCGKASPASVISMYLKNDSKRYKIDDFKKFRGTLFLNQNDTDEFYYILKDAIAE